MPRPQALMALSMFKTTAFAFYFIVSSCSWMGSSCFIVGPKKQFQNMKQPKRRYCASASAAEHLFSLHVHVHICRLRGCIYRWTAGASIGRA
jgi:hypothetical protein